jgi:hypothetical protein
MSASTGVDRPTERFRILKASTSTPRSIRAIA